MVHTHLHPEYIQLSIKNGEVEESGAWIILPPSLTDDQINEIFRWHKLGYIEPTPAGLKHKYDSHENAKKDAIMFGQKFVKHIDNLLIELSDEPEFKISYGLHQDGSFNSLMFKNHLEERKTCEPPLKDPHYLSVGLDQHPNGYVFGNLGMDKTVSDSPFSADIDEIPSLVTRTIPFYSVVCLDLLGQKDMGKIVENTLNTMISKMPEFRKITIQEFNGYME